MKIVIVNKASIPVYAYGGTERVVWDLAKGLVDLGHEVVFLVPSNSSCEFAQVIELDEKLPIHKQIPRDADIVHFQFQGDYSQLEIPYLVTEHGNTAIGLALDRNTVFVSKNHAQRHGSECFVRNGLDWSAYGDVDWKKPRNSFHFLGKAAWRVKNVSGAIDVAKRAGVKLHVLGGERFNFKRGIRLTFSRKIHFHGMVGGNDKFSLLNSSEGLIFPVKWHEPFGLAIIESMYFGCPVFATPYGAIPELVPTQCGILDTSVSALSEAILSAKFNPFAIHQYVVDNFNHHRMTEDYLRLYKKVINGNFLNSENPCMMQNFEHLPWNNF
ncbi:MAG: glycosyltransferase [Comamonas sp.]